MTEKEIKNRIKKQLHGYGDLEAERLQILRELERVEAVMAAPRAVNMDGMPRSSGPGDPVLGLVSQHIELQERYRAKLCQLARAQMDIETMIAGLEPVARRLLRYRYLDGLSWEAVCEAMAYCWSHVHRIHGRALDELVEDRMKREEQPNK